MRYVRLQLDYRRNKPNAIPERDNVNRPHKYTRPMTTLKLCKFITWTTRNAGPNECTWPFREQCQYLLSTVITRTRYLDMTDSYPGSTSCISCIDQRTNQTHAMKFEDNDKAYRLLRYICLKFCIGFQEVGNTSCAIWPGTPLKTEITDSKAAQFRIYNQGCINPGNHVAEGTKFSSVTPNICGTTVWNLLHIIPLAPRILRSPPGLHDGDSVFCLYRKDLVVSQYYTISSSAASGGSYSLAFPSSYPVVIIFQHPVRSNSHCKWLYRFQVMPTPTVVSVIVP
jgi:hypothetical protein